MMITGPRKVVTSGTLLAILVAAAFNHGCLTEADLSGLVNSDVGAVELAVRLSDDATIARVAFEISGNGITEPRTGDIAVLSSAATASAFVGGIAAGSGYRIAMMASSTDGQTTCAGNGTFDVRAGENSAVSVLLQCRIFSIGGGVQVGGTFNNCPQVTSVAASRVSAPLGGTIDLRAAAADLDAADVLTFAWTSSSGVFEHPSELETAFRCTVAGAPVLTATVSDGRCTGVVTLGVTCLTPACGNSFVDPGEQCDPPMPGVCDGTCHRITLCGNGSTESTEECDPPNGTTCDSSCRNVVPPAGDGSTGAVDGGVGVDGAEGAPP